MALNPETFTGVDPITGEEITVTYHVDSRLSEYHPEKMGDKDMGFTPEQEKAMDEAAQTSNG